VHLNIIYVITSFVRARFPCSIRPTLNIRTIASFVRGCGAIELCNWCEKVSEEMQRALSPLYAEAHVFILQGLSSAFLSPLPSGNTSFPPSCLSYLQISVTGNETTSPWAITRAAHARTHARTFLPAAATPSVGCCSTFQPSTTLNMTLTYVSKHAQTDTSFIETPFYLQSVYIHSRSRTFCLLDCRRKT
jgi:hypothetical protein